MRIPTHRELRKFVEVEGWVNKDAASGRATGDHFRYVFITPMGERLATRISHGTRKIQDADLFKHILRDQLQVSEEQFWLAVDKGVAPVRKQQQSNKNTGSAIDAKLARNLIQKVGLTPQDLAGMTQATAVAAWTEWLTHKAEN